MEISTTQTHGNDAEYITHFKRFSRLDCTPSHGHASQWRGCNKDLKQEYRTQEV